MAAAQPLSTWRRVAIWALILSAALIGFVGALTVWVQRQALVTDNWVKTSDRLLQDPEIRQALSVYLVDQLYANVNVPAELQAKLPPSTKPLAGPLAGALRELSVRAADELLSRPATQALWEEANRTAHTELIRIIDGKSKLVGTNGDVVLDLRPLIDQLAARTNIGKNIDQKLGPDAGKIVIMKSDQLSTVQKVVRVIRALSVFILFAVIALFALAVYLAHGRRRVTLRSIGITTVVVGILLLVVRQLAGNWIVDTLAKTQAARPPVTRVWLIGTDLLAGIAWTAVAYGLVILVAAWIAGPSRPAVWVRRQLAPSFREHPGLVYAIAAAIYLLVVLWGPTPAFREIAAILVFAAIIALGIEALRRLTLREFPDVPKPAG